ncbi:lipase family protein [Nitratireductor luteus]|uniref:lipase family protein n=1 Tax=Nitratireductor luteus TaxID=2976980 RepID=UPI00223FAC5E|nr:lipase family protein [Nitratireductor luteus]
MAAKRWAFGLRSFKIATAAVFLAALTSCAIQPIAPGAFYQWDRSLADASGKILRVEPLAGAPEGAQAWRILYRSAAPDGTPIAVSGTVYAPNDSTGKDPRPVVAWAHPTTGVATQCAPSLFRNPVERIAGLKAFLDHGFVVAATDYPGLGTPGPHPYLVGASEGRSVLDSVRAAANLPEANAGRAFAVWGHSQGGHAALFTGQLAKAYAPDLRLVGVAAAAPATSLATLLHDDMALKAGKVLTSFSLWSWNRFYGAPLDAVLIPSAKHAVDRVAAGCIESRLQGIVVGLRERVLQHGFLKADLTTTEPWKSLIAENTPAPDTGGVPLFLAQGSADTIVDPQLTVDYAQAVCRKGLAVYLDWQEGVTHDLIGAKSADQAAVWLAERFAGTRAPDNCAKLPKLAAGANT